VLEDIKEKRANLYPKVPVEDFSNKAVLEKKFDHVFETMRGKYKAQRSEELAQKERERDARKARNSRHSARKTAVGFSFVYSLGDSLLIFWASYTETLGSLRDEAEDAQIRAGRLRSRAAARVHVFGRVRR
jgi:hypothetical protein